MKKQPTAKSPSRKLGANRNELSRKQRKPGSRQSRDVHEDRSARQIKFTHVEQTFPHGRAGGK